jgi:uncharacterized lipoprotein YajG
MKPESRVQRTSLLIILAIALSVILLSGCSKDDNKNPVAPTLTDKADCAGCHENETMLKATALPDTTSSGGDTSGEG